jgi:hypothetical protein
MEATTAARRCAVAEWLLRPAHSAEPVLQAVMCRVHVRQHQRARRVRRRRTRLRIDI